MLALRATAAAALVLFAFPAFAETGLDWLVAQQNQDGSVSRPSDIASPLQSSAEAIRTLAEYGQAGDAPAAAAVQFLLTDGHHNTETLSRKIIAGVLTGTSVQSFVTELLGCQSSQGGFGEFAGYEPSILDTSFALEALAYAGVRSGNAVASGVGYLLNRQQADGSWQGPGNASETYVTALALGAIWQYRHVFNVTPAIQTATAWLLQQRHSGALWDSTFESAAALAAIAPALTDLSSIQASLDVLRGEQAANGSFGDDVFVTALALRALAAAARPNADEISITGRVVDGDAQAPLAGANVTLTGPASSQLVTDAEGRFSFRTLAAGTYQLTVSLAPYSTVGASTTVQSGQAINFGDIALLRTSTPIAATLRGRVAGKVTSLGIGGARIEIAARGLSAISDASGNYEIAGIPNGAATVAVTANGYAPAQVVVNFSEGSIYNFSPQMATAESSTVRVEGVVTSAADGSPLSGVTITARVSDDERVAETDDEGGYEIVGLPAGELTVSASKEGYYEVTGTANATAGSRITFSPPLTALDQTPPSPSPGAVRGVVRDSTNGQPLASVAVRITIGSTVFDTTTDVEGMFGIEGVTGSGTIRLTRSGYQTIQASISVASGMLLDVGQIEMVPNEAGTGGAFKAIVRHGVTDAVLSAVSVRAIFGTTTRTASTNSSGAVQINNINPLEGTVELTRSGFEPASLGIVLTAGELIDLGTVYLRPAGDSDHFGDLIVRRLDPMGVSNDPDSFAVSGTLRVSAMNAGATVLNGTIDIIAFSDVNANRAFDVGVDRLLGSVQRSIDLSPDDTFDVDIALAGELPFRDAPISVLLDRNNVLIEQSKSNNYDSTAGLCSSTTVKPAIDLALCMDGSGSVSPDNFQLQLQGTAAAIEDAAIIPHDGTVRLSVLQFSGSSRVELSPTMIDADNVSTIAERIRGIRRMGGGTSIHACVDQATQTIVNARPATAAQVIDVSTDGGSSQSAAVQAANRAEAAGIDALNALAVGAGANLTVLNAMVFPRTGGEGDGFVVAVPDFQAYANALAGKIRRETRTADLTVGGVRVIDNGPGQTLAVEARIGNAGARTVAQGVAVSLYVGDPDAGGVLLQELSLPRLDPGDSMLLRFDGVEGLAGGETVVVVVDRAGSLGECDKLNNRHGAIVTTTLGDISVSTNAPIYEPNSSVLINAPIVSTGSVTGAFESAIEIRDADGALVASFDRAPVFGLAPGATHVRSETWNTGTFAAGTYTVHARLYSPDGSLLDQAQSAFEIVGTQDGNPLASLRTTTDKPRYHTTDLVLIADLVRNVTVNAAFDDVSLELLVTTSAGAVIHSAQHPLGQLGPGAVRELQDRLGLADAETGFYQVSARIVDAAGQELATDTASFEVFDDPARALAGVVTADPVEVYRGQPVQCTDIVINRSTRARDGQIVRQGVIRLDVDADVSQSESSVDLLPNGSQTLTRSVDTSSLAEGDYACVLEARTGDGWTALGYAAFKVLRPPIEIDASLGIGDKGRVLILLDGNRPASIRRTEPNADAQRDFLEQLLTAADWSYTIVTDAEAFAWELRSGAYSVYALFAEHEKLSEQVQKELREAVYRGEGLVDAGSHDQRHQKFDPALGTQYAGKHADAVGVDLFGEIAPPGHLPLTLRDKALRARLAGATEHGRYVGTASGDDAALTAHAFGEGTSVYAGFDLLAEAVLAGNDSLAATLLLHSLTHVQPDHTEAAVGEPVPLRLQLTNRGIATPGRAVLNLPPGTEVLDSGTAQRTDDQLVWTFDLAEDAEQIHIVWLRLPAGPLTLEALIQSGIDPDYVDQSQAMLDLNPQIQPGLSEARTLAASDRAFRQVLQWLDKAAQSLAAGDAERALFELTKAADAAASVDHPQIHGLRRMIGQALRDTGRQL
jgi:hypothetical protein